MWSMHLDALPTSPAPHMRSVEAVFACGEPGK
ncbi:hypothetical protein [Caudoviricetes sp.]|nr:hypothetical protein [Caudoviricetes sp.]